MRIALALIVCCLTISHTCLPCLPSRRVKSLCSTAPYDWTDGGSVGVFLNGMVLLLWGVDAILQNGCGTEGQIYIVTLRESEMTAGCHYRSLILDICFTISHTRLPCLPSR